MVIHLTYLHRHPAARCEGVQNIHSTWQQLVVWREASRYRMAQHQWLEECFTTGAERIEDYVFDHFLPIVE